MTLLATEHNKWRWAPGDPPYFVSQGRSDESDWSICDN
jgi:hypothetical protein